ncbi:hypothetical protein VPUCM_20608 [Vibrio parahaemolyticus UCM-V493]|nr:hypothetical protein VPUCM_20608 [Vibrio parahaemolyticus UCM-V493]
MTVQLASRQRQYSCLTSTFEITPMPLIVVVYQRVKHIVFTQRLICNPMALA